jgi:hypothetical protein
MLLFTNDVSYLSLFANCITNNIVEMASSSFVRVVRGESAMKRPMTKVEGRGEGGVMGGRCWGTKGSAKSDD